ncbi:MAG: carbon starvation protein A [Eubacteriales bacterium]|nr:carbon starvation protein A [Eubacteriales bacterium]
MSGILILVIAILVLAAGYIFYGGWLAKKWGIDPNRKTPAHEFEDGVDYCPAKAPVLLGHHFASIAGAGPINGPIQAAVFGWVPVLLWILIGGIFIGAVQDFSALFISLRNKGKSIGEVMETTLNHKCKLMFSIFTWLVMLLVDAAFADIVAKTFFSVGSTTPAANGSVATASLLFIPLAIVFGFVVYRKHAPLAVSTIAGVAVLIVCVTVGLKFPLQGSFSTVAFWRTVVFIYCAIASVTPVWILLQPRDYLNSFLLYFMIGAAVIGIVGSNPDVQLHAFSAFDAKGNFVFPALFITVACGAVSGFHSLISSGTTSKQLDNEKNAKMIGYGAMLIECVLAVVALICIGAVSKDGTYSGSPATVFASAIEGFFVKMGLSEKAGSVAFTVISLAVSAFCLTSLDTCCRLGRFTFQELFAAKEGEENAHPVRKALSNMYVATLVNIGIAAILCVGGYATLWKLFGACNQLVSVPALMAAAVYLKSVGKKHTMFYVPMFFMAAASLGQLGISFVQYAKALLSGKGAWNVEGLLCIFIIPIFILALSLLIEGCKVLFRKKAAKAEA